MDRLQPSLDTTSVALDSAQLESAWTMRADPFVDACVSAITERLLAGDGLVDGHKFIVPLELHTFVLNVVDAILVIGIVPVEFVRGSGETRDRFVPHVPARATYTIRTRRAHDKHVFEFCSSDVSAAGPKVVVMHNFGFDPDLIGNIRSVMLHTSSIIQVFDGLSAPQGGTEQMTNANSLLEMIMRADIEQGDTDAIDTSSYVDGRKMNVVSQELHVPQCALPDGSESVYLFKDDAEYFQETLNSWASVISPILARVHTTTAIMH